MEAFEVAIEIQSLNKLAATREGQHQPISDETRTFTESIVFGNPKHPPISIVTAQKAGEVDLVRIGLDDLAHCSLV